MIYEPYKRFIENELTIIDKNRQEVQFKLNQIQNRFVAEATGRDVVLKARQMGFTAFITAAYDADFILKPNSQSVVVADSADNAISMLERVKWYLESYETKNGIKVPLKYNSKYELANAITKAKFNIGTAQNVEFGRSRTIDNAHLSEAAFYPQFQKLLASLLQAVVPTGKVIIETTANGFNDFKAFWDATERGETGFKAHFYAASELYPAEFLAQKRKELGERLFKQEYPETPQEAFITSGAPYFDQEAMAYYLEQIQEMKQA